MDVFLQFHFNSMKNRGLWNARILGCRAGICDEGTKSSALVNVQFFARSAVGRRPIGLHTTEQDALLLVKQA